MKYLALDRLILHRGLELLWFCIIFRSKCISENYYLFHCVVVAIWLVRFFRKRVVIFIPNPNFPTKWWNWYVQECQFYFIFVSELKKGFRLISISLSSIILLEMLAINFSIFILRTATLKRSLEMQLNPFRMLMCLPRYFFCMLSFSNMSFSI